MAKYILTITDLESGEIRHEEACDAIMGATISQGATDLPAPKAFGYMTNLLGIEAVALLMALDALKDGFLGINPVVALGYSCRNKLFSESVAVDITELKKTEGAL